MVRAYWKQPSRVKSLGACEMHGREQLLLTDSPYFDDAPFTPH